MVSKEGAVLPRKKAEFSNFWRQHKQARWEPTSLSFIPETAPEENAVHKNMLMLNTRIQTVRK